MATDSYSLDYLKALIRSNAEIQTSIAELDYQSGINDCKNGIYDKWFRYHRPYDGFAYDIGWRFQNETTQCETVTFLEGN